MSPARTEHERFDVSIKEVPVTEQRLPFIPPPSNQKLRDSGTARANEAASLESPHGTQTNSYALHHRHQTVLQQHIAFFDPDSDGVIWPLDTFTGFHRLGYNLLLSILAMLIIHINISYPTVKGWFPDPFVRVYAANIHKDKHGSDSGTYDNEGRFVPQKFEDIVAKYASGDKQGITLGEVFECMKGQRVVLDPFGWGGALFEWIATWILLRPEDGRRILGAFMMGACFMRLR